MLNVMGRFADQSGSGRLNGILASEYLKSDLFNGANVISLVMICSRNMGSEIKNVDYLLTCKEKRVGI